MGEGRSCLADWLNPLFKLSPSERSMLEGLEQSRRAVTRGTVIRRENEPMPEVVIVRRGWLYSSTLLADGNRQIIRFFFSGDVAGLASAAFGTSTSTLVAVSDSEICTLERSALRKIFTGHPRLGGMLLVIAQLEQVVLTDRLAATGRLPARARVAALLAEIAAKLPQEAASGPAIIHLPLTQEEIGDAVGLTAVHVNRMLRSLAQDGYIARENSRVSILDEDGLRRLGNYADRRSEIEADWLMERA